jgi:cytochrome b561
MSTTERYNKVAIILHWFIGLAILLLFALGFWMSELPKDLPKSATIDLFDFGLYTLTLPEPLSPRAFYFNLHKSIGVTLLVLIGFRIFWRLTHAAPAFPATMQKWEQQVAEGVHKLLYLLMIVMPISGVLTAVYSKYGILWFGIPLVGGLDNAGLRDVFKEAHEAIGVALLVLIGLHVVAALKHKLVDKDDVMKRMSLR